MRFDSSERNRSGYAWLPVPTQRGKGERRARVAAWVIVPMGILATASGSAQRASVTTEAEVGTATVEWLTLSGDLSQTRYSPAAQIDAENFGKLTTAWTWDGASFNARSGRATPSYMNGKLITVAGERRYVVAIDPATGETLWSYREPNTARYEYSMRKDYGKGVAYAEIGGRGVVYITSPAFFLTALDADTGAPLEGFGKRGPGGRIPEDRRRRSAGRSRSSLRSLTRVSPSSGATSRPRRRRSSSTASSSSATRPSRATTSRASRTYRATSSRTMP